MSDAFGCRECGFDQGRLHPKGAHRYFLVECPVCDTLPAYRDALHDIDAYRGALAGQPGGEGK